MPWDANWATSEGTGKLPRLALNELRLALTERYLVLGGGPPSSQITETLNMELLPKNNWFVQFQGTIDTLFDFYANHTDSGGDWTGKTVVTDVGKKWNETDMLTAIGDASRISAPKDAMLSASWMFQQYKMINMLRWVREAGSMAEDTTVTNLRNGISGIVADPTTAYNDAVTDFNGNSFNNGFRPRLDAISDIEKISSAPTYRCSVQVNRIKTKYVNYSSLGVDVQLYCYTDPADVFEDTSGISLVNSAWSIIGSGSVAGSSTGLFALVTPTVPSQPPTPASVSEHKLKGFSNEVEVFGQTIRIVKFDGSFTYKDW